MGNSLLTNDAKKTENRKDMKKITLRQFRRNEYNNRSINEEANNGRNDINSTTNLNKSNIDKVDIIPNKVENNEVMVISDDEDALETLQSDVTEHMKSIDNEIIEISDDEDPLQIVDNVSYFANQLQTEEFSKEEPNYNQCIKPTTTNETAKTEDLQTNSAYSNETSFIKPNKAKSPKQDVEYNNTDWSKGELLPKYNECSKPITTNEMLTKNEDLQSNSEYSNEPLSFKKPLTEESSKQVVEYNNNTENSKVELVINYSECLKTVTINEMLKSENLQCSGVYSNEPLSFKKPNAEDVPKQDVEYNYTECSKGELLPMYSECLKSISANEMLSTNEDLPSNSEYLNVPSSFKKPKAEEAPEQVVEYHNTECPKVKLGPNYSECLKPITTNEMSDNEDIQSNNNREYSNIPTNFKKPNAVEAPKQNVKYNAERSKGELLLNYSEYLKTVTTNEMLSKNEDLQLNSAYSNSPSFKKPDTEESPKGVEYNDTQYSNEHTIINSSIKIERPIEVLPCNNSECVKMIDTIELPTQDLQFKNNITVPVTNTDEFSKHDPDLNNKECLNELTKIDTNEFTSTFLSLDDDCDGYHSSDFEFIDEDEAKKCPNFLSNLGEASEKVTVNTGHKFKQPLNVNVKKRAAPIKKEAANKKRATIRNLKNENISENADIENPATINEANPVLDENENINADVTNLCSEENEMLYNYLQTLQTPSNEQFNKDYRDTHRIPNDEEYLHLFSGMYSPYPMSPYGANKKVNSFATKTAVVSQEMELNMCAFAEDSSPEQRQQARDTEMKIITKYGLENRPRRRCNRRFLKRLLK